MPMGGTCGRCPGSLIIAIPRERLAAQPRQGDCYHGGGNLGWAANSFRIIVMNAPLGAISEYINHWYQWVAIIGLVVLIVVWVAMRRRQ
jgi:hypothetical protein